MNQHRAVISVQPAPSTLVASSSAASRLVENGRSSVAQHDPAQKEIGELRSVCGDGSTGLTGKLHQDLLNVGLAYRIGRQGRGGQTGETHEQRAELVPQAVV